jgi:hypothetical protein
MGWFTYVGKETTTVNLKKKKKKMELLPPSLAACFMMAVFLGVVGLCRSDMVEETSKKKSEIGFAAGELNLVLVRRKWRWSIRSSR